MIRKFGLITAVAVMAVATIGNLSAAEKKYGPGVTDTEIKLGQTMPYSGPASGYAVVGRVEAQRGHVADGTRNSGPWCSERPSGRRAQNQDHRGQPGRAAAVISRQTA